MRDHTRSVVFAVAAMGLCICANASDDPADALQMLSPVTMDELSEARGQGSDPSLLQVWNDMNLDASLSDNVNNGGSSGNNSVSHGAFTDIQGFATVIQNSGNHVIIQNATIVNVHLE